MVDSFITLLFLFQVLLAWFLWYVVIRDYQRDAFRQKVFAMRDELFDYVSEKNIPYDHPAHVRLRNLFNGAIQFSDRIDLFTILFSRIVLLVLPKEQKIASQVEGEITNSIKQLNDQEAIEWMLEIRQRFKRSVAFLFITTSPVVSLLALIVSIVTFLFVICHTTMSKLSKKNIVIQQNRREVVADRMLGYDRIGLTTTAEVCSYNASKPLPRVLLPNHLLSR